MASHKPRSLEEMKADINRRVEASKARIHRLFQVLNEFNFYTRDSQLDLAEAAVVWAFAALAFHDRRDECESNFYALADRMFLSSMEADYSLSESAREQMMVAATAVAQHLTPRVNDILRASATKLAAREREDPHRMTATVLHDMRHTFLEHSAPQFLCKLIVACLNLCGAIDRYVVGVCLFREVDAAMVDVGRNCADIEDSVFSAIEANRLVVKDGKIVKNSTSPEGKSDGVAEQ